MSRKRWSWPKRAVVAAGSLVGAFVGWMLLLNIALWTGFVSWAASGYHRMSGLELEYGSAYVLWPTRVHVRDFELRIDAYRYQLELVIPEGEVDVALWELLTRRFHARYIYGENVSAKFRYKAHRDKVPEVRRDVFAPIENMTEPVRLYGPPNIPPDEKAFEIDLENIDGTFVSLWIDELEFTEMDARLRGALRARAGHLFAVDDALLEVWSSDLKIGGETIAVDWMGTLYAHVSDYNPFVTMQRDVLRHLSVDVDAVAQVVSLAPADPFLAKKKIHLREGKGPLDLRIMVDEGVLMPSTEVLYRTNRLSARKGTMRGHAGLRLAFGIGDDDGEPRSRVAVELHDVHAHEGDSPDDAIVAEEVIASLEAAQTDLTAHELPLTDLELTVPKLVVKNVRALAAATKKIDPKDGSLELGLHTKMKEPGKLVHTIKGGFGGLLVTKDTTDIRATGNFSVVARSDEKLRTGRSDDVMVDIRWLNIKSKNGHSTGAWLQVHRGTLAWDDRGRSLTARVKGRLDDLRPIISHIDERKRLAELVPDLELTAPFDFDIEVKRDGESMDMVVKKLDRPGLHIEGFRHAEGKRARSAFWLDRAHIGITRDEKQKRKIDVGIDDAWMRSKIRWAKQL